jgi:hypothetical protein
MKLFHYRKPSLNTILGITKAKKQIKNDLGIYKVTRILNFPTNLKRRALRKVGYYSEPAKILRNGLPKPGGGCLVVFILYAILISLVTYISV